VWKRNLLILVAALVAYLPAINNGFIADDWVILHRVELLKADPFYLNQVPPENFRSSSYVVFAALKSAFDYDSRPYYLFNILLHALNCVLLYQIVFELTKDPKVSLLSAVFLAVFQSPQEAVMWLAAMNETLSAFFVFLTLLLWLRARYTWAAVTFGAALFSKESAFILVLMLPLLDLLRGRRSPWRAFLALAVPAVLFIGVFLRTLSSNFQINNRSYAFGPHGLLILFKSLHRLVWPSGYIVAIALLWFERWRPDWKIAMWATLIAIAMLPYIFVTYTNNIPSRQLYLASSVFLPLMAASILRISSRSWRRGLAGAFIAYNVIYMWMVKDSQMLERARPTTALVETLAQHPPTDVRIQGFAYPYADIARGAAISLPGWRWDQVDIGDSCANCLLLRWDRASGEYSAREMPAVP
jgi:hypothetical protein